MHDPILGMIGLCARAGYLIYGANPATDAMKHGKGKLLILASDAGSATVRNITRQCDTYGVARRTYSDKFSLGRATGKTEKAVLLVTESNMATAILKRLDVCSGQTETEVNYGEIE